MSISDRIVVMKDGILQQIGKPQQVYDDPVNLFVAKFLGTPPINVFDADVKAGKLYLNGEAVLDAAVADGPVTAAIRPEGFIPCDDGPMTCDVLRMEVMGRDTSVVCGHPAFAGENFRAIIDSDDMAHVSAASVRFRLKPGKVFLFDAVAGVRIRF